MSPVPMKTKFFIETCHIKKQSQPLRHQLTAIPQNACSVVCYPNTGELGQRENGARTEKYIVEFPGYGFLILDNSSVNAILTFKHPCVDIWKISNICNEQPAKHYISNVVCYCLTARWFTKYNLWHCYWAESPCPQAGSVSKSVP